MAPAASGHPENPPCRRAPGQPPAASDDTIVHVATPAGPSTCAILRLSGPRAIAEAARLLRPEGSSLAGAASFRSIPAVWEWRGVQAPLRVSIFRAPRSYTREDLVEISLPGSPPLVAAFLRSFLDGGGGDLRLALPGEFTLRAFRSGRIDLSQAEAVAQLIGASSEAEERAAERQLRGELRSRVEGIAGEALSALALVEAVLDFADDDLPSIGPAEISRKIAGALASIDALRVASALRLPDTGALRAALAGFPNAGKSSLLNALLGRPAAIVADRKGTTRDPVRGVARSPGGRLMEWTDLAGFESLPPPAAGGGPPAGAAGEDLQQAISRLTRVELDTADVVVWVVDGADGEALEGSLAAFCGLAAPRKVIAFNKADLLSEREIRAFEARPERPVAVSALTGRGLEDLATRAAEGGGGAEPPQFLVTARQEAALDRARRLLREGAETLRRGEGFELAAVDLREALGALDEITGREVGEKVLEEIFSRFCLGK